MAKRWTGKDEELLKLQYPDKGPSFCSRILDKSTSSVAAKARRLGLKYKPEGRNLDKYSDKELLDSLKRFELGEGRVPEQKDCSSHAYLKGSKTYSRRFGSWNKALKAAGLKTQKDSLSDEDLIESLKAFTKGFGRPPIGIDFKPSNDLSALSVYVTRFGSLNKALLKAGIIPTTKVNIQEDELINSLKRFYKENSRAPKGIECTGAHPYLYSTSTYVTRFGSFVEALTLAGVPSTVDSKTSIAEQDLVDFLHSIYTGELVLNSRPLKGQEIDILIPELAIGIEYDGLYWHSESLGKTRNYHLNKTIEAKNLGYRLIHIFENEWTYKQEIVKSRLNSLLGNNKVIYARKCTIREVSSAQCKEFLNRSHIQGNANASIRLGLYYNEELVALQTFCKTRFGGSTEWELLRYCNKLNTSVVGGASKLFKAFIKTQKPNSVVSYSDIRWNIGGLYEKLGFKFSHQSKPNYWYFKTKILESRVKYQKHKLKSILNKFDSNKTEYENMLDNGYKRIFDCGNKVFIWTKG